MEAIILAGGVGKRMRPLTDERPKPMVEVGGKPILLHQIEHLKKYDIDHFVVACRYKWEAIRRFFGDGKRFNVSITYCVEKEPLGRGGAIKNAYQHVRQAGETVLATNGDNLFDVDVAKLLEHHQTSQTPITITLVPLKSQFGVVEEENGKVLAFREKIVLPHWINAGVYVLEREAIEHFPTVGDQEESTFPEFANRGKIAAYLHRGFWKGVDNAKDLSEAEEFLAGSAV
ncbi:MAG: nucleotidyltransferase family protein [Patescibacteria group bacterium]